MVAASNPSKLSRNSAGFAPAARTLLFLSVTLNLLLARHILFSEPKSFTKCESTDQSVKKEDVSPQSQIETQTAQKDFYTVGLSTGTDKVQGPGNLKKCIESQGKLGCLYPSAINERCRPWGHYYHTMYNKHLGPYSTEDATSFQALEIGYFRGGGYDAYSKFMPRAELHSLEVRCECEKGKQCANNNRRYPELVKTNRLHCGDASNLNYLNTTWHTHMKRPGAPPLMVVVEDGSHHAQHIAQSIMYWFPKIEPGGLFFIEDILPLSYINKIKTEFLPQLMADLHYCGPDKEGKDTLLHEDKCFPTIQPLLASIHCEMHICVLERNEKPAVDNLSFEEMSPPSNALDKSKCNVFAAAK